MEKSRQQHRVYSQFSNNPRARPTFGSTLAKCLQVFSRTRRALLLPKWDLNQIICDLFDSFTQREKVPRNSWDHECQNKTLWRSIICVEIIPRQSKTRGWVSVLKTWPVIFWVSICGNPVSRLGNSVHPTIWVGRMSLLTSIAISMPCCLQSKHCNHS